MFYCLVIYGEKDVVSIKKKGIRVVFYYLVEVFVGDECVFRCWFMVKDELVIDLFVERNFGVIM